MKGFKKIYVELSWKFKVLIFSKKKKKVATLIKILCRFLQFLRNIWKILKNQIFLSLQQHASTSLVGLFFPIRLICLIWHSVIFGYSRFSKISLMVSILQMIYRWNKVVVKCFCDCPTSFYEGCFKSKVTLRTIPVKKRKTFETRFIGFLAKFPTFLHNHLAHWGSYCNAKVVDGCHCYITQCSV